MLDAGQADVPNARQALEELCCAYWFPLYAYSRRHGYGPDDAMDLTQTFFVDLLENSWLKKADPERGRFRSFLLTVFRRFLTDQQKQRQAIKRGGDRRILSIDAGTAEQRFQLEPTDSETAADIFERQWAMALLERVHTRLRDDYAEKKRSNQFDVLQQYLAGPEKAPYAETAEQLNMSVGNVKVAVHRLRQQFRRILTNEVSQTVESRDEVQGELQLLLAALSRET